MSEQRCSYPRRVLCTEIPQLRISSEQQQTPPMLQRRNPKVKLLSVLPASPVSECGWLNIMGSMSPPLMVASYRPTTQPPTAARGQKAGYAILLSRSWDGNGIVRANASLEGQRHLPKRDHLGVLQSGSVCHCRTVGAHTGLSVV